MKCQILLSGKNEKNILKCPLLSFLPKTITLKNWSVPVPTTVVQVNNSSSAGSLLRAYALGFFLPGRGFLKKKKKNGIF